MKLFYITLATAAVLAGAAGAQTQEGGSAPLTRDKPAVASPTTNSAAPTRPAPPNIPNTNGAAPRTTPQPSPGVTPPERPAQER
jgi:hypothetical protein